jgi:hypothetical protein
VKRENQTNTNTKEYGSNYAPLMIEKFSKHPGGVGANPKANS